MQYRYELKFLINYADYALIRARLSPLMQRDLHVNDNGMYTVRSLYFDDFLNSAYNEKYMGVMNRQKFRIRIYNYSDSVINLERKVKYDRYVTKQSVNLTRDLVNEILAGNYDCLREYDDPLHTIFYYQCRSKLLRPRTIVDYEREPFVMKAGTVRVTFDQHVRVGVDGWDIFNDKMSTMEVMRPEFMVMEVKYTEFLPALVRQLLPRSSTNYSAVSKYVLGCDQTLHKRLFDY
jgi:hypothetical protein